MESLPIKLTEYFSPANRQYLIPLFQRAYVWKKEHWETLWNDIMSYYGSEEDIENSSPHFMGAVVSIPVKTIPVGVNKYLIIDGQQRLTTISILLCALREVSSEKYSGVIQDLLENRHQKGTPDYLKLLPTQGDRDVYSKLISKEIDELKGSKHKLFECYKYFIGKLQTPDDECGKIDPEKIYTIVNSLFQVVMINLTDTDDPYLIFESLNFKGEKLTQTDLIRNLILMKFQHSTNEGGEQQKIYDDFWLPLEKLLSEHLEDFFFDYVRMRKASASSTTRIYSDMKKILNSSSDIYEILKDIWNNAQLYNSFLDPSKESNSKIQKALRVLNRTKSHVIYSLLLKIASCRGNGIDDDTYLRCLKILNSFIIRRAICRWQTYVVNTMVINLLSAFPNDVSALDKWLAKELLAKKNVSRWPNDEDFKQAIITKNNATKEIQILFLEEIEKFISGKEVIDLSHGISLEHIMPQTLSAEWEHDLGSDCNTIHEKYISNLGNLTLTGYNSEYSNYPFAKKKSMENGYSNSGIRMNQEIAKNSHWGENEIIARAQALAEIAVQIWEYPNDINSVTYLSLNDSWTYQKVHTLVIDNNSYPVSSWKEVAQKIFEYIKATTFEKEPEHCLELIEDGKLPSIDTQFQLQNFSESANQIQSKIKHWLSVLDIDESLFKFGV